MVKVQELLAAKGAGICVIDPDEPVLAAIQAMSDHGIGALLVMRGANLVGIVSERDYARKVVLKGRSSAETPVWQIMSAPVHVVDPDATVATCMMLMTEKRIRHLPVVADGELAGEKVLILKKRRRKNSRRLNGHRRPPIRPSPTSGCWLPWTRFWAQPTPLSSPPDLDGWRTKWLPRKPSVSADMISA